MGRIALERGDANTALSWLNQALEKGPNDFQVHYNLGRTYAALGDRKRAKAHFDSANAAPQGLWFHLRDPLDRELHAAVNSVASLAATFEANMGRASAGELIVLGERILARRPADVTMMGNLAGLYRSERRFEDAYAMLDAALELAPGSARLLNIRAEVSLGDGKPEAALREAERAIAADSTASRPHATKGRALATLDRYEEAAVSLERALELDADRTGAVYVSDRYALAEVERLRGRLDAARAGYEAVLAIAPGYGPARQRLQALGRQAK